MSADKVSESLRPTILFEDAHLIVLSKPAGLLSQGESKGDPNLVDWLRQYLGRHYVGLIHRLDRNTSGIMVIAKRTKAANRLTQALRSGEMKRAYLGWVKGTLHESQKWTHFLLKDPIKNKVAVVASAQPGAKNAILNAKPIKQGRWKGNLLTLVEFVLETGRSHQIRAQASHEGFPLLGDQKYGKKNDEFGRPALHSHSLSFPHPMSHELLNFTAPLPNDMRL
jgi:23S rRNA pseudouridine1911/1915/1917 synthase